MTDKGKKKIKLKRSDVICYLKSNPEIVFSEHEAIFEGMVVKFGIDNVDHPLFNSLTSFGELAESILVEIPQKKYQEDITSINHKISAQKEGDWRIKEDEGEEVDEDFPSPDFGFYLECDKCNWVPVPVDPLAMVPIGTYCIDNFGNRHFYSYPDGAPETLQNKVIRRPDGKFVIENLKVGKVSPGYCADCKKDFEIDYENDELVCPHCNSHRIGSITKLHCFDCCEGSDIVTEHEELVCKYCNSKNVKKYSKFNKEELCPKCKHGKLKRKKEYYAVC